MDKFSKAPLTSTEKAFLLAEDPEIYKTVDRDGVYTALLSGLPPMLTREEAATFLRRDPKAISEMCRSGMIPGVPLPPEGTRMKLVIPKLCLIKYLVGGKIDESRTEESDG